MYWRTASGSSWVDGVPYCAMGTLPSVVITSASTARSSGMPATANPVASGGGGRSAPPAVLGAEPGGLATAVGAQRARLYHERPANRVTHHPCAPLGCARAARSSGRGALDHPGQQAPHGPPDEQHEQNDEEQPNHGKGSSVSAGGCGVQVRMGRLHALEG